MNSASGNQPSAQPVRTAVLLGLFIGTAVGVGYLLSGVPNVELMTFVVTLSGGVLGGLLGFIGGFISVLIYSLGNPYGAPVPQLLAAQAAGMGLAGLWGGLFSRWVGRLLRGGRPKQAALLAGVCGVVATLTYDVLTNLAIALSFATDIRVVAVSALPFTLVHLATNLPLFLVLFPLLLPRFVALARSPLRGVQRLALVVLLGHALAPGQAQAQSAGEASPEKRLQDSGAASLARALAAADSLKGVAAIDSAATAKTAADSAAADNGGEPAARDRQQHPLGKRPLWDPFPATLMDQLERQTAWVPVIDGGFGSRLMLMHEADTSPAPRFLRDDIPLGTGHRWADDPWLVAQTGLEVKRIGYGLNGTGGTGGEVELGRADPQPDRTVTDTRFYRGDHETYLRSLSFVTPRAPLRLSFDFEESIDQLGYDFRVANDDRFARVEKLGEAKFRSGRGSVVRQLDTDASLAVDFETIRKHKTGLPAVNLQHEEVWGDHAALTWKDRGRGGRLRASVFWTGRDVERNGVRKLETGREGVRLQLASSDGLRSLQASVERWRLSDTGADSAWALQYGGPVKGEGHEAHLQATLPYHWSVLDGRLAVAGWWNEYGGWLAGGRWTATPGPEARWCTLSVEVGGRAPRSDELLTADQSFGPDRGVTLLPNADLTRERTVRGGCRLEASAWGTDLALSGSYRSLSDGIAWVASDGEARIGRWQNGLQMDSYVLVAGLRRQGRFAGWLRLQAEVSLRHQDIHSGIPTCLPPERSASLQVLWEKRFFREDGILEIGYWLQHRGGMNDPWLPGDAFQLPAQTRHDLTLAFRLVGTDLSLGLINLTDERFRLSSGALSSGRELRWRLHWTFSQ